MKSSGIVKRMVFVFNFPIVSSFYYYIAPYVSIRLRVILIAWWCFWIMDELNIVIFYLKNKKTFDIIKK